MKHSTAEIIIGLLLVIIAMLSLSLIYDHNEQTKKDSKKLDYIYSVMSDPEQIEINLEP